LRDINLELEREFENRKTKGGDSRKSQSKFYWATMIPINRHNLKREYYTMNITKEMIFTEFKDATKKDQSKKKETFTHRISYLKTLKEDMIKVPKNFSIKITPDQIQNLIDDWSASKPIDAFYKRIFGMTFAEKKQQEEAEYFTYENGEKKEVRKTKEKTQSIH